MKAAELRTKLAEGLRVDSSGRTTPIQRLTPFLNDLITFLEERDSSDTPTPVAPARTTNNSGQGDTTKATGQQPGAEQGEVQQSLGRAAGAVATKENAANELVEPRISHGSPGSGSSG